LIGSLVVLAGLVGLGLWASTLIRFSSDRGDLVLESDDPTFAFSAVQGNNVTLEDRKSGRNYQLRVVLLPGNQYELEVTDAEAALSFRTRKLTIKRGERVALSAWFERKPEAVPPAKGADPRPLPAAPAEEAWFKNVAALPAQKQVEAVVAKLKERNPGFESPVTPTIEKGVVTGLVLHQDGETTAVPSDLSPLRALTGLESLHCEDSYSKPSGVLTDLSSLRGLRLKYLSLRNTGVSDLSPLKGMPLESLSVGTKVHDLTPLKGMRLINLGLYGSRVTDLSLLKEMPLKEIECHFKRERDAAILRSIKTLVTINSKPADQFWKEVADGTKPIAEAWFKEIAALPAEKQAEAVAAKLKERNPGFGGKVKPTIEDGVVTRLSVGLDHVRDLSPVRALTGLKVLDCDSHPGPDGFADLAPLRGLKLQWVGLAYSRVSDLTPLKDMKLRILNCGGTQVADLAPLKGMPLVVLVCHDTKVADLSPLAGAPLKSLNCVNTPVADLTPLKGMPLTDLDCWRTRVTDLAPLRNLPLKTIRCDFQPARDAAILRSIKTLETINGKPADLFWKEVDGAAPERKP
jgi:Leucine-rich repeat (LRR) protein